jgi:hypothetical protein
MSRCFWILTLTLPYVINSETGIYVHKYLAIQKQLCLFDHITVLISLHVIMSNDKCQWTMLFFQHCKTKWLIMRNCSCVFRQMNLLARSKKTTHFSNVNCLKNNSSRSNPITSSKFIFASREQIGLVKSRCNCALYSEISKFQSFSEPGNGKSRQERAGMSCWDKQYLNFLSLASTCGFLENKCRS